VEIDMKEESFEKLLSVTIDESKLESSIKDLLSA